METQTLLRYIAKCSKCREETDLTTDHQNVPKQLLEFMRKIVIKVVWCYKVIQKTKDMKENELIIKMQFTVLQPLHVVRKC